VTVNFISPGEYQLEAYATDEVNNISNRVLWNFMISAPANTPYPTQMPRPSATPLPTYPTLYADQNYQCRVGPGKTYDHAADIYSGTSYRIIRRATNGWYEIAINFSNTSHKSCWIGGGIPSGDIASLPVVEVASKPTDSPNNNSSGGATVHVTLYCNRNGSLKLCGTFIGACTELTQVGSAKFNGYKVWLYSTSPEPMYFYNSDAHQACPAQYP
jgi:hypothetical protein